MLKKVFMKGEVVPSSNIFELHKKSTEKIKASSNGTPKTVVDIGDTSFPRRYIDYSYLASAAKIYDISPNIHDYVCIPVPIVTAEIPNRNSQAFEFKDLISFDPTVGRMLYQTFIGKPTHIDHKNSILNKAKGINLDAALVPMKKYKLVKIFVLAAFDRSKDIELVGNILDKKRNCYSMGALAQAFQPLVGDTLISTEKGLQELRNVNSGTLVETTEGLQKCEGKVYQGIKPVNSILLSTGQEVKPAETHPFLTLDKDMSIKWKMAKDLRKGDIVAVASKEASKWPKELILKFKSYHKDVSKKQKVTCQICGKEFNQLQRHITRKHKISIVEYKKKFDAEVINASLYGCDIKYPKKMTPELGALIGYTIADGCIAKASKAVTFHNTKQSLLDDRKRCWDKSFSEKSKNRTKVPWYFLEYLGLSPVHSSKKEVPWSILQSPKDIVISFLRAFWECDGSARHYGGIGGGISYCSSSKLMLQQIQLLLQRLDIKARIDNVEGKEVWEKVLLGRTYMSVMYSLDISEPRSILKHINIIGSTSEERKADLKVAKDKIENRSWKKLLTWSNRIPGSLKVLTQLKKDKKYGKKSSGYFNLSDGTTGRINTYPGKLKGATDLCYSHFFKYKKLLKSIKKLDPDIGDKFQKLIKSGLVWGTVLSNVKNRILEPVYCLVNVKKAKHFIANGIIVSNCSICNGLLGPSIERTCTCFGTDYQDLSTLGSVSNKKLHYHIARDFNFIEISNVSSPADVGARSNNIM